MAANIEENITRVVEIDNMEQLIKVSKLPNLIIIDFLNNYRDIMTACSHICR